MGAGAATTETEPRSRLQSHQSARRLGPRYRLATTYGVDAALLLTKASKTAGRLRRVAARAPAPDDDWAARERRRAVDVERRLLCRELHEVATYDKYFPRARAFVAVTIFLNHDGEGVAAASRGAAPIAFRAADLPGARPRPELPDDLHAPPDAAAVAPLLQSGNVLTIASENDALALALVDAPYEPAYLRFAPRVLRDVERRTRGAPPPPPLAADRDRFEEATQGRPASPRRRPLGHDVAVEEGPPRRDDDARVLRLKHISNSPYGTAGASSRGRRACSRRR